MKTMKEQKSVAPALTKGFAILGVLWCGTDGQRRLPISHPEERAQRFGQLRCETGHAARVEVEDRSAEHPAHGIQQDDVAQHGHLVRPAGWIIEYRGAVAKARDPDPHDGREQDPHFAEGEFAHTFHVLGKCQSHMEQSHPIIGAAQHGIDHHRLPTEWWRGLTNDENAQRGCGHPAKLSGVLTGMR